MNKLKLILKKSPIKNQYLAMAVIVLISIFTFSCRKKEKTYPTKNEIPEFYKSAPENVWGTLNPNIKMIADNSSGIIAPTDLDFNPKRAGELWITNLGTENTGGSTVMITGLETPNQKGDYRKDQNSWHFMSLPTALSFSDNGNWGTSTGVLDANHKGGTFTGPSLWSSDLNVYAMPSGGNGSHLDMLHGSPYSMGIAAQTGNIFWVFDGYNNHLVKYDFGADHGPGAANHDDGIIHRYTDVVVAKDKGGIPSHMVLDDKKEFLYIVDGGNKRIIKVNINTGAKNRDLPLNNEVLREYWEMKGVDQKQIVDNLQRPCGIDIVNNRLFYSDFETGEIVCFDVAANSIVGKIQTGITGITGIKVGPDGKIWFVSSTTNSLYKVEPK